MNLLSYIPNLLTLGNLCCGTLAIHLIYREDKEAVMYLCGAALALDFLDGLIARLLHSSSKIGAELDSLADMVTFGLLPSLMLLRLTEMGQVSSIIAFLPLAYAVAAAVRLARFNVESEAYPSPDFSGLPSPAAALAVYGIYLGTPITGAAYDSVIVVMSILISILMISKLPFLGLKSLSKGKLDTYQLLLIACFAISTVTYGMQGVTIAIGCYIFLSLTKFVLQKKIS